MKKIGSFVTVFGLVAALVFGFTGLTNAATTVNLGTADGFAVLAGTAITNVPTSVLSGDLGLSPAAGSNYSGITQAQVTGSIYSVDASGPAGSVNNPALLTTAKNDLTAAYLDAAGRTATTTLAAGDNQLGGQTLTPGVYAFGHAATANITAASPLTLNAQGDANAVFIFQASSDLVTASGSVVALTNGAQACNVFWQVTSSATLGTGSTFKGNILALTSITVTSGVNVAGRVLARNAAVTLDSDTITKATCTTAAATTTTTTDNSSTTGTTTTTKLPAAGTASEGLNIAWMIIIPVAGIIIGLVALYFLRKKRLVSPTSPDIQQGP